MITGHKYRESYNNSPTKGRCAWLGTCGRPREEHAESVALDDRRRHWGKNNSRVKK